MRPIWVAVAMIAGLGPLQGHETWLMPDRFTITAGEDVPLQLTSGDAFPALDHAIKPDRVASAGYRIRGKTSKLDTWQPGPNALLGSVRPASPGVAAVWVSLKPRPIELTAEQVEHYLDEIGAPLAVRTTWEKVKDKEKWKEIYTKYSKTFIRVGDPKDDRSWADPVGIGFEIVPRNDPFAQGDGEYLAVTLLRDGKPLGGQKIALLTEKKLRLTATTAGDGKAIFPYKMSGGRVLITSVHLRRDESKKEWVSEFTTLTLEPK